METKFDKIRIHKITKWMIGVVTSCILIYLAIRHIDMIAMGISWLIHLRLPYAPMIGALVGVTALIPIVGAFIGMIAGTFLILTVSPLKAFYLGCCWVYLPHLPPMNC